MRCWVIVVLAAVVVGCSPASAASPRTVYFPLAARDAQQAGTATPIPTATHASTPTATTVSSVTPVPANSPTRTPMALPTATVTSGGGLTPAQAIDLMDGQALLYSQESPAVYLGLVSSNCYGTDSIVNDYGTYGSPYQSKSIRNQYGSYGSPYATLSAFNPYTSTPPIAYMPSPQGYYGFAYITANAYLAPHIDSALLIAYLRAKGRCS